MGTGVIVVIGDEVMLGLRVHIQDDMQRSRITQVQAPAWGDKITLFEGAIAIRIHKFIHGGYNSLPKRGFHRRRKRSLVLLPTHGIFEGFEEVVSVT
jgi:hypothetical protein